MGQVCRRSAVEAASQPECKPDMLSPQLLKQLRPESANVQAKPAAETVEEKRQRGVRPKMPRYDETPLLTIGKEVRIVTERGLRRATIDCVNHSEGTVDIAFEDEGKEDATVPVDTVRPLEDINTPQKNPAAEHSTATKRQLGIRPNAPAYSATPLITVGKQVRIQKGERSYRATIECVDEAAGMADVVYQLPAAVKDVAVHGKDGKQMKEETVPISTVKSLEDFEVKQSSKWIQAFSDDFHGAVRKLKEGADDLFIELKDHDAAVEYYSLAIDKLKEVKPSELGKAIVTSIDLQKLLVGDVHSVDLQTQQAFVTLTETDSIQASVVKASLDTVIPLHLSQLSLQGNLYLNRALTWIQVEHLREATKDLLVVICLGTVGDRDLVREDQLVKALLLRAKLNLCRMELESAKADVAAALKLTSTEETGKIVWQLHCDLKKWKDSREPREDGTKEPVKDNTVARELAKFAGSLTVD